jgi:hypothetical protein
MLDSLDSPVEKNGVSVDWRTDLAHRLVNSQKTDPRGGGFWAAATHDLRVAETAYGLLCMLAL